ncbi:MAG: ATP-binding protein [Bdellovibrionia bacterium]
MLVEKVFQRWSFKPIRLKTLIFVSSAILSVIPVSLFGISQAIHWRSKVIESFEKRALTRAELIGHEFGEIIQSKRKIQETLAQSIADLGIERSPKLDRIFAKYRSRFLYRSLFLVDANGNELGSKSEKDRHFLGDDADFKTMIQTGQTVISDAISGQESSVPVMRIFAPIYDAQGRVRLALCSSFHITELQSSIYRVTPGELELEGIVMNKQKRVLASTGPASRSPLSTLASYHPLLSVLNNARATVFHGVDERGTELHGVSKQMTEGSFEWVVAVSTPYSLIMADAKSTAIAMLRYCGIAFLISLAIAYFIASGLSLSLGELSTSLLSMEQKNLNQPIQLRYKLMTIEMADLKSAFDRMRARLSEYTLNLEKTIEERTQQLEAQRARSEYAGRLAALGDLAGSVAHEINNPLMVICGNTEMLQNLSGSERIDPGTVQTIAGKINETAFKIAKIVKSLRAFARDGSQDKFETVNIQTIVNDTADFLQRKFQKALIDLKVSTPSFECMIECQAGPVSQALLNILKNAYDAAQGQETKWVRIETADLGDEIQITVTDSGSGISVDLRDKIMRPLFTTKGTEQGMGLGLSISERIIASHHGKLALDEKAPNTSFVISLPKRQPSSAGLRAA